MPVNDDVATEFVIEERGASGRGRATVLRMSWRRGDPLAVVLLVTARPEHPSLPRGRWVVLRDFLRYGLEEPTGDGDVRIRPAGPHVILQLRSGVRPWEGRVPSSLLGDFLDATERIVPAGEERSGEALDALIERLLEHGLPPDAA